MHRHPCRVKGTGRDRAGSRLRGSGRNRLLGAHCDAIGNLVLDQHEGVKISWTPYGKVREVRARQDSVIASFRYDGAGNRIEKKVTRKDSVDIVSVTRYVRDAGGNVMAVYKDTLASEFHIYGSSRLGLYKGGRYNGQRSFGEKQYELSNHLGNVLATITDNIEMNSNDSVWASVVSTNDYYPFGLEMEGRTWSDSASAYRYGFNGKEKDDGGEWGNTAYDYGFRIYNPSIGKFLSVDPLTKKYPELTSYQFASNTPIWAIDVDGLEAHVLSQTFDEKGNYESGSFTWDENASPLKEGQLHYNKTVGNTTTSSIESANNIDYKGGNLNPTSSPSSILGTEQYYSWRDNDFNVRQSLMDTWHTWQPSSPDYYMGYGDKYVKRFSDELLPNLSLAGQEWLDNALINLQSAIEVKLQASPSIELENRAFGKFAFDSHVSSYENAGLFNLPIRDLIKIGTTPDISDLLSPNGLRQVRQVTSDYVGHARENPIPTTLRVFQFGFSIYRNIREQKGGGDED